MTGNYTTLNNHNPRERLQFKKALTSSSNGTKQGAVFQTVKIWSIQDREEHWWFGGCGGCDGGCGSGCDGDDVMRVAAATECDSSGDYEGR